MKSKTSYFNRTIFIKNVLRFWPMWALYMVVLFFLMPVSLYFNTRPQGMNQNNLASDQLWGVVNAVNQGIQFNLLVIFAFAIIFAALVFGYLYNARNCNMMHALPVTRGELFTTGYFNILLFFFGPQVLMFFASLIVCIVNGVTSVEYLLYWLVFSMIFAFLFTSIALFACMLSGNVIAVLIFYATGNFIYPAIKWLIGNVVQGLSYGLSDTVVSLGGVVSTKDGFLSPLIYILYKVGVDTVVDEKTGLVTGVTVQGLPVVLWYLVPAVVFLVLAIVLYRRRQLECAGDIVAYRWMNPIFRWLISFVMGTGLGLVFAGVFFQGNRHYAQILILFSAGMALVFFLLAEMILKKRFRIFRKKCWLECAVCTAVVLFLTIGAEGDLFGVESRIPDADRVAAVEVYASYGQVFTERSDMETVTDLHRNIVAHKKEYEAYCYDANEASDDEYENYSTCYISMTYYLNNGKTLSRSYSVPADETYLSDTDGAASKLAALEDNPEAYLKYLVCANYEDVEFTGGYLEQVAFDGDDVYYEDSDISISSEAAQIIFEAFCKDVDEGNYPYSLTDTATAKTQYYNTLSLNGRVAGGVKYYTDDLPNSDGQYYEYGTVTDSSAVSLYEDESYSYGDTVTEGGVTYWNIYPWFDLYTTCTHTIQALIDTGVIESESDLVTCEQYNEWIEEGEENAED